MIGLAVTAFMLALGASLRPVGQRPRLTATMLFWLALWPLIVVLAAASLRRGSSP